MEIKNVVCYSFSLHSGSALAHLRLVGPLGQANINIINGIESGKIVVERVRDGDIVIIQRDFPREFSGYEKIIEIARAEQKPVIFEFDDHLFYLPDNHPDRKNLRSTSSGGPTRRAGCECPIRKPPGFLATQKSATKHRSGVRRRHEVLQRNRCPVPARGASG